MTSGADLPAPRPCPATRTLVQFTVFSLLGAGLFVFHGIALHLTPWSQAMVNGVVKHVYPTRGQNATAVVLFREENLRDLNESYPVSYERHADVLDAIASYGPHSVFIDFAFLDERTPAQEARLREALCHLAGVVHGRVYLAVPPPDGDAVSHGVTRRFEGCAQSASAQMDREAGVSGVLTYCHGTDDTAACGGEHSPSTFMPTPAFAMARHTVGLIPEQEEPMEIIWANRSSRINEKWMNCQGDSVFRDLFDMLRHDPLAVKRRCPYTHTVSVAHLLGSFDKDVQAVIAGNAVFYGAAFEMVGDRVISPVFHDLPGVYLHAMAYDNLVSFGLDYKRALRRIAWATRHRIPVSLSFVLDFLFLMATVAVLLFAGRPSGPARRLAAFLHWIGPRVTCSALGATLLVAGVGAALRWHLSGLFLAVPLLLALVAVLCISPVSRPASPSPRQFLRERAAALLVAPVLMALFLAVDAWLGVEEALLLVLVPAYLAYKVLVARDTLFFATGLLLVGATIVSFLPPINLGPRNIVAYVAFFEVARHAITHLDEVAMEYFRLRIEHPAARTWGVPTRVLRIVTWLFGLCLRAELEGRIDVAKVRVAA